jgi:hypothetical protein
MIAPTVQSLSPPALAVVAMVMLMISFVGRSDAASAAGPATAPARGPATQPSHHGPAGALQTVTDFLNAIKSKDYAKAGKLVKPESGIAKELTDFEGLPTETLEIAAFDGDKQSACVMTSALPEGQYAGNRIIFLLHRAGQNWLIDAGDQGTERESNARRRAFVDATIGASAAPAPGSDVPVRTERRSERRNP